MERFHIEKKIGAGAQATAYLAHLVKDPTQQFVLKRLAVEQVSLTEMAILHKLNHPAVIRCYDAFTHDGDLFLVLQYADGGDLEKIMSSAALRHLAPRDVLPLPAIERLFMQLCLGLQYCHEQRTLHRDIKTANIFVAKDMSRAMLGDFGVAKQLAGEARIANTMVGTPFTFAPETVSGQGYTYASDVWALGCVLYEMLTFKKPFPYSNLSMLVQKVSAGEFEPLPNSVPSHYRRVIKGMLQVDVNKRYSLQECLGEFSRKAVIVVQNHLQTVLDASINDTPLSPKAKPPSAEKLSGADKQAPPPRRPGRRASVAPDTESPRPENASPPPVPAPSKSPQKKRSTEALATGPLHEWVKWKNREFEEIDSYLALFRDADPSVPVVVVDRSSTPPGQIQMRRGLEESDDPMSPAYVKPRTPPGDGAMNANRAKRLLPSPHDKAQPGARQEPDVVPMSRPPRPAEDAESSAAKRERDSKRVQQREMLHQAMQAGRQARSLEREELEAAIGLPSPPPQHQHYQPPSARSSASPPGRNSGQPMSAPASVPSSAVPSVGGQKASSRSTRDLIREQRLAAQKAGSGSGTVDVEIVLPSNLQHLLPDQKR